MSKNPQSSMGGTNREQHRGTKTKIRHGTLQPMKKEKYSRDIYNHKFTIKEDAFKVLMNEKKDSPRYIDNKKEFNEAVNQYIMKGQVDTIDPKSKPAFQRNTRMGGHLTSTLSRAGLNNLGIMSPVVQS